MEEDLDYEIITRKETNTLNIDLTYPTGLIRDKSIDFLQPQENDPNQKQVTCNMSCPQVNHTILTPQYTQKASPYLTRKEWKKKQ